MSSPSEAFVYCLTLNNLLFLAKILSMLSAISASLLPDLFKSALILLADGFLATFPLAALAFPLMDTLRPAFFPLAALTFLATFPLAALAFPLMDTLRPV